MKKIVLRLYEFDELSKDSQEKIIERERWNVMDCCMEAYGDDYISTMKSFGDLTNTEAYDWEVGYTRYDFRFKFKYNDPIYWACPLINDDYTGLTNEECEGIKRFLEAAEGYPVDVDLETQGFYRYNDAGTLPGECADFIFHKYND